MPQISRNKISTKLEQEINEEFREILRIIGNESEMDLFITSFLTKTEKLMLSKRFAVARLLLRGWGWREVSEFLKVSKSTVNRMQRELDNKSEGYLIAINKLNKHEKVVQFWKRIDSELEKLSRKPSFSDLYK